MRFSVWPHTDVSFHASATTVAECERLEHHAAYLPDHLMPDFNAGTRRGDTLESTVSLAAIAATSRGSTSASSSRPPPSDTPRSTPNHCARSTRSVAEERSPGSERDGKRTSTRPTAYASARRRSASTGSNST